MDNHVVMEVTAQIIGIEPKGILRVRCIDGTELRASLDQRTSLQLSGIRPGIRVRLHRYQRKPTEAKIIGEVR